MEGGGGGGGCDGVPDQFTFTDLSDQLSNTPLYSNIIAVTGVDEGCPSTISAFNNSGVGEFSFDICLDVSCSSKDMPFSVVAANSQVSTLVRPLHGKYIRLNHPYGFAQNASKDVTFSVENIQDVWSVATGSGGGPD